MANRVAMLQDEIKRKAMQYQAEKEELDRAREEAIAAQKRATALESKVTDLQVRPSLLLIGESIGKRMTL
jgi:hypothetical protein